MSNPIGYVDRTWNPVTGCSPVSEACDHCYARRMATRLRGRFGYPVDEPFRVTLHPDKLNEPRHWCKPQRVFVCSMGDLFHEDVPDIWRDRVFAMMAICHRHTFLLLTKRPERALAYASDRDNPTHIGEATRGFARPGYGPEGSFAASIFDRDFLDEQHARLDSPQDPLGWSHPDWEWRVAWPLPNVWLGVTAENQETADERIPILLDTPAVHRFISCEPLLGPVNLDDYFDVLYCDGCEHDMTGHAEGETHEILHHSDDRFPELCGRVRLRLGLDLVIVGGENGPGARKTQPEWKESIERQCERAGVDFYFKGWGSRRGGKP
jgi:protein gp37